MAKRNKVYYQDKDGHFHEVTPVKITEAEQLTLDLYGEEHVDLGQDHFEFSMELDDDESRQLHYALYDPDDIRDRVIDCVDAIRNSYLNGAYYVAHAENTEDILKADKISKEDALAACHKLAEILDVYVEACENEYLIERNPVMKTLTAKDLN